MHVWSACTTVRPPKTRPLSHISELTSPPSLTNESPTTPSLIHLPLPIEITYLKPLFAPPYPNLPLTTMPSALYHLLSFSIRYQRATPVFHDLNSSYICIHTHIFILLSHPSCKVDRNAPFNGLPERHWRVQPEQGYTIDATPNSPSSFDYKTMQCYQRLPKSTLSHTTNENPIEAQQR